MKEEAQDPSVLIDVYFKFLVHIVQLTELSLEKD